MKLTFPLTVIASVALFAVTAQAADKVDHKAHHPAASTAEASPIPTDSSSTKNAMNKMDTQIAVMREKHEKMLKAKTLEERMALMTENMKTMQASMSMMKDMHSSSGKMSMAEGMTADMATCHSMMEKRMEMMESMMQMMMDQMSPAMK